MAHVDGNYFRRVVVNLLTNAVQAMPDGGRLSVEGEIIDGKVSINISDTGVGISEENKAKLFTPLFTTKAKGTGLGLAVCKRIIDAHMGSISVDSVEGEGTTFTILLPVGEVDEPSPIEAVFDSQIQVDAPEPEY
jgi:signal transduction histidine kinase